MSNYAKERNLITINLDNCSGSYVLDLNTGILLGVKGQPIKTCPRKSEIVNLFPCWRGKGATNLTRMLNIMFDRSNQTATYVSYLSALQGAEKIDALGLPYYCLHTEQYAYINEHFKDFSDYIRNLEDKNSFHYSSFYDKIRYEKAKRKYQAVSDQLTNDMLVWLVNHNCTETEANAFVYYVIRGKLGEYHDGCYHVLDQYFKWCRALDKKPDKVNNFMREYCETRKDYKLKQAEYDTKLLQNNYKAKAKAWQFAYGDYIITIPQNGEDIIEEGRRMRHCVGSYVSSVVNNETYICFVRHKDTPDIPYITCQVHTDGEIGQYFLSHDRRISKAEDIAFKNAFALHLRTVWDGNHEEEEIE